jgi:hypothetical protein
MSIKSKLQTLRTGVSIFGLMCAFSHDAFAGNGTITVKDSAGTTQTFDVVTDGSGNFIQKNVNCDYLVGANCGTVDASHNQGVVVGEPLPGGTNTLGSVNAILTSLPGGTATLGSVNAILTSLPGGTNTIGVVNALITSALPGGTNTLGSVNAILTSLPGGTATLGTVNVLAASSSYASGAFAVGSGTDGWNVTDGTKADAVCTSFSATCSMIAVMKYVGQQAASVVAGVNASIPAGSATIGAVLPALLGQWGLTPIAPGTAPTNAMVGGVVYSSTAPTLTTGQSVALLGSSRGGVMLGSQYPAGAIPISASNVGSSAATTATLAPSSSLGTAYLCVLSVRSNATGAATGTVVVSGPATTLSYAHWTAPLASGMGVTEQIFTPCTPASAANVSILAVSPAPGSGGLVTVDETGYSL